MNETLWLMSGLSGLVFLAVLFLKMSGGVSQVSLLRCLTCGHVGKSKTTGMMRVLLTSSGKQTLGTCQKCGGEILAFYGNQAD